MATHLCSQARRRAMSINPHTRVRKDRVQDRIKLSSQPTIRRIQPAPKPTIIRLQCIHLQDRRTVLLRKLRMLNQVQIHNRMYSNIQMKEQIKIHLHLPVQGFKQENRQMLALASFKALFSMPTITSLRLQHTPSAVVLGSSKVRMLKISQGREERHRLVTGKSPTVDTQTASSLGSMQRITNPKARSMPAQGRHHHNKEHIPTGVM